MPKLGWMLSSGSRPGHKATKAPKGKPAPKPAKPVARPKIGTPEERAKKAALLRSKHTFLQNVKRALHETRLSDLPALTAVSDRQSAYARDVRASKLKSLENRIEQYKVAGSRRLDRTTTSAGVQKIHERESAELVRVVRKIRSHTDARWWLDHKNDSVNALVGEAIGWIGSYY